jgi:hypothetical protein
MTLFWYTYLPKVRIQLQESESVGLWRFEATLEEKPHHAQWLEVREWLEGTPVSASA